MVRAAYNRCLHVFAVCAAVATLALIGVGGLVTSHGVGMSVPDWPTTYGYNMFFFPLSKWVGGIFYEHSHRLVASGVGLMTVILAVWLWIRDPREWMRWLGVAAVVAVVAQGVLGGVRVTAMKDELGIFHATFAQLFFALMSFIALATSRWWWGGGYRFAEGSGSLRRAGGILWVAILVQLILGATMRHQHAGLAIPDFPAAHGAIWPDTSDAAIARYNQQRSEVLAFNPITRGHVWLQMTHRILALGILIFSGWLAWQMRPGGWAGGTLRPWFALLFILVFWQAFLGAATIWTNKSADIATSHVALGALTFVLSSLLVMVGFAAAKSCAARREAISPDPMAKFSLNSPA